MNPIREQVSIWFRIGAFLLIWVSILGIRGVSLVIGWEAIKLFPEAIGIYALMSFIFIRWTWKWAVFRGWLITTPVIQGTWKGTLQSTWIDPSTGQTAKQIDIYLVIRQTL